MSFGWTGSCFKSFWGVAKTIFFFFYGGYKKIGGRFKICCISVLYFCNLPILCCFAVFLFLFFSILSLMFEIWKSKSYSCRCSFEEGDGDLIRIPISPFWRFACVSCVSQRWRIFRPRMFKSCPAEFTEEALLAYFSGVFFLTVLSFDEGLGFNSLSWVILVSCVCNCFIFRSFSIWSAAYRCICCSNASNWIFWCSGPCTICMALGPRFDQEPVTCIWPATGGLVFQTRFSLWSNSKDGYSRSEHFRHTCELVSLLNVPSDITFM